MSYSIFDNIFNSMMSSKDTLILDSRSTSKLQEFRVYKYNLFSQQYKSLAGNQRKWKVDSFYVKKDLLGYESVSEVLISHLLKYTDISPDTYVNYKMCNIIEGSTSIGRGCFSLDFKKNLEELTFRQILERNLIPLSTSYDEVRDLLFDYTGQNFKKYIDNILCLDAITFNDDRYFGNFTIIKVDNTWKGIIFDNGNGCLSDLTSYPMGYNYQKACDSVLAKPFSFNFLSQLNYVTPILIRYKDFINSVEVYGDEAERALNVIKYSLEKTRGIAWEEF